MTYFIMLRKAVKNVVKNNSVFVNIMLKPVKLRFDGSITLLNSKSKAAT